jgi:transcriptional regulator with XRE-family HTH domain
MDDFGSRLKAVRIAADISVAILSEKSGVSVPQIHNLEVGGSQPTVATVAKLSAALGVPTDI